MYISAKVEAGAKREKVEVDKGGRLTISVKEPAEQNLANKRVLELVAKHAGVPKNKVRLVSGAKNPSKKFEVLV